MSFTFYKLNIKCGLFLVTYSRVCKESLVLRHPFPHFPPISGSTACWVAELNAAKLISYSSFENKYVTEAKNKRHNSNTEPVASIKVGCEQMNKRHNIVEYARITSITFGSTIHQSRHAISLFVNPAFVRASICTITGTVQLFVCVLV